jgi:hypothetical protein
VTFCTNQIAQIAGVGHHRVQAWLSKDFGFRVVEAKVGKGRKRRLRPADAFAVIVAMRLADHRYPGGIAVEWHRSGLFEKWWAQDGPIKPVAIKLSADADMVITIDFNGIKQRVIAALDNPAWDMIRQPYGLNCV